VKKMKGKIERKKRIGKIGTLVVLGIFIATMVIPVNVVADEPDWNVDGENLEMGYPGAYCEDDVGIGTDDPTTKLHVVGDVTIDSGDLNVDSGTLFVDESADRVGIGDTSLTYKLEVNGEAQFDGALRARDGTGIGFKDDGGNLGLWVEDGGQVGIGVSDPAEKLEIDGNIM
jgi:hypothetical protein